MTFSLIIRDLTVNAHIGITEEERAAAQRLQINLTVELDQSVNPQNDDMAETVDYDAIVQFIRKLAVTVRFNLLETFAQHIGQKILKDSRNAITTIRIEKLDLYNDACGVGIELKIKK